MIVIVVGINWRGDVNLMSTNFSGISKKNIIASPTPTPAPTPKQFKFDSSTDLEKELESINPQVSESDFE